MLSIDLIKNKQKLESMQGGKFSNNILQKPLMVDCSVQTEKSHFFNKPIDIKLLKAGISQTFKVKSNSKQELHLNKSTFKKVENLWDKSVSSEEDINDLNTIQSKVGFESSLNWEMTVKAKSMFMVRNHSTQNQSSRNFLGKKNKLDMDDSGRLHGDLLSILQGVSPSKLRSLNEPTLTV